MRSRLLLLLALVVLACGGSLAFAASGPSFVLDINPGSAGSSPESITDVGGTGFFVADDGTHGFELWKTDGTAAGTSLVKDIVPGSGGSFPSFLTDVNGTLFFTADDGVHGNELWSSDGTAAGTTLVKDINPGGSSQPTALVDFGGTLFFAANDGTNGRELWRSDGTDAGTTMVKDINAGGSSTPSLLTVSGSTLFFSADDGIDGDELWKSDGTALGTTMVKDINPNPNAPSGPSEITDVNGTVFFSAFDGTFLGLWKSDGTGAGTVLLKGDGGTGASLGPQNLTNVAGTLFFTGDDGSHGRELWKSDGTSPGTVIVKDINPGLADSNPDALTDLAGTLVFQADDGTHGVELWRSDGTGTGTTLVSDINPFGGSGPAQFAGLDGQLYFSANDGSNGDELWRTDGTGAGTALVADINPGSGNSFPSALADVNGNLLFGADDGVHGSELWKLTGTGGPTTFTLSVTTAGSGTVTSSPAGIDCGSACSHAFASGTDVTLTATAAQGSVFSGWSGACTGTSCTVHMSQARSVTATFTGSQPTALFTMPGTIRPGAVTTLNANASLNASRYLWDLNGDGHNDVSCSTSQLQTQFMPSPGSSFKSASSLANVRLTVVGPTGATSSASQSSPFTGGGTTISAPTYNFFQGTLSAYCVNFRQAGICITPSTLSWGVVQASGCDLHLATGLGDLPSQEDKTLVQSAIDQYNNGPAAYVTYVKALCAIAKLVGDPANCAVVSQIDRRQITGPLSQNSILLWESRGPVTINGLVFTPAPGHALVVSPLLQTIFSGNVTVTLNGAPVALPHQLSFSFRDVNAPLTQNATDDHIAPVAGFDVSKGALPGLAGLVPRHVDLSFVRDAPKNYYTLINATLGLPQLKPNVLSLIDGISPATVTGNFRETNTFGPEGVDGALQLSDVHGVLNQPIDFGDLLPLKIDAVHVDYLINSPAPPHSRLAITGSFSVGDANLNFGYPPDPNFPDNGIVFVDGGFSDAGATLNLPCPDLCIHLFPGVDLDAINFHVATSPTVVVRGGGDLNVIDLVNVHGGLAFAFPTNDHKWTLDKSQIAQLPDDWTPRMYSDFTIALAGNASMNLPILKDQTLANAYFVYSFPGYIAFGGGVTWNFLGIVSFDGGLSGEVNAVTKRFNFAGHLQTCVADVLCSGAFGVVSSSGAGACFVVGPVSVGGGIQFPDHVYIWPIDGCKWSRFTADNVYNRRLPAMGAAAEPYSFTIKAGDPSHAVQLDGVDNAPEVEVTGPGGIDVTSSSGDCAPATATTYNGNTCLTVSGKVRIMRSPRFKETVIGVQNPAAGTYTVTPLGGSTFANAYKASDTGSLGISGSVSGSGLIRTFSYNARQIPGEKITFLDQYAGGAKEIGNPVINGGSGVLKFSPPAGTALHQIVAEVELAGIPVPVPTAGPSSGPTRLAAAPRITIASFRPPKPPKLGVVSKLKTVRHGTKLAVTWRKAPGAVRYAVVLTKGDATSQSLYAKRTSASFAAARTDSGRVTVRAIAADGRIGKPAHVAFTATAKAPTLVAAYPAQRCVVPKVVGLTERAADKALLDAGCAEGKVTKRPSKKSKGRVLSQSSAPHSKHALGTRVNLVVGR